MQQQAATETASGKMQSRVRQGHNCTNILSREYSYALPGRVWPRSRGGFITRAFTCGCIQLMLNWTGRSKIASLTRRAACQPVGWGRSFLLSAALHPSTDEIGFLSWCYHGSTPRKQRQKLHALWKHGSQHSCITCATFKDKTSHKANPDTMK